MTDQVRTIMASVLDLDADTIDESTCMENTAAWDSMNHLNLCLALEQEFQVSLDVHEMESMITYSDIVDILQRKL